MKILITGGNGQLAYDLKKIATAKNILFAAPSRDELSILEVATLSKTFSTFQPDIVINTAAFTAVDRAETEKAQAYAVNFLGVQNLVKVCNEFNCPLLHLSTDYVFDGDASNPYQEQDATHPINYYGETKRLAEEWILAEYSQAIILRVSGVFGVHGHNFVKTILRLARERETLRIVADQITCPTPSYDIAASLLTLCENFQPGLFHYCSAQPVSWFDFANQIVEIGKADESFLVKNIQAIATSEYPLPAKRPAYSVLNCDKIQKTFGIKQPDWKIGLQHVIKTLSTA